MGRGALRARVNADGEDLDLVTCHLKSKLLSFPGQRFSPRDEAERARYAAYALYRRSAEAVTVHAEADKLLDGHGSERPVIVLGDLNDEPDAGTTQILLGPRGSEIATPGFDRPDRGDASRLWNLAPLIPQERRFSRIFRGRGELIDHILVSHNLVNRVEHIAIDGATPACATRPRAWRAPPRRNQVAGCCQAASSATRSALAPSRGGSPRSASPQSPPARARSGTSCTASRPQYSPSSSCPAPGSDRTLDKT